MYTFVNAIYEEKAWKHFDRNWDGGRNKAYTEKIVMMSDDHVS